MARDILSGFGPNTSKSQASPAECGGVLPGEEGTIPYSQPVGPKGIGDAKTPGLHGTNHGNNPK